MKRSSTIFLRLAVGVMGLVSIALNILVIPELAKDWTRDIPETKIIRYPTDLGLLIADVAFFVALWQTLKLLGYIDKNIAFSNLSVKALRNIKFCALAVTGGLALGLPFMYYAADTGDAPGLLVIFMLFMGASLVVAVFAAVLQRLLQNAIEFKSENDLTV